MLNVSLDASELTRLAERAALLTEKNLRYATGRAMAATVQHAEKRLKEDLARTSGGPIEGGATRWTIGGTYTRRPSPTNLVAEVGLRSDQPRAAGRYIRTLTEGGKPRTKGADLAASELAGGRRVTMVPTPAQRLDSRGNVTRAAFTKALTGWASMRQTRTLVNRANRMFVVPIRGPEGRMGIFERTGKAGRGRYGEWVGATMRFTLEPNPKPRASTYDLRGDLQRSAEQFWPGEIRKQLLFELNRAGLG
jgi:hypothetical protein